MKTCKILTLTCCILLVVAMLLGCSAPAQTKEAPASSSAAASSVAAAPASSSAAASEAPASSVAAKKGFKIAFANSSLNHPWRIGIQDAIANTAKKYPEIVEFYTNEAGEDPVVMNNNVEDLISKGIDLLLVCTVEGEPFAPSMQLCKEKGIPLVPVDRGVVGEDYTCFITQNNITCGEDGANFIAEELKKKYGDYKGKVVELQGVPGNLPAELRKKGFHDTMESKYPNIEIVAAQPTDYTRANSLEVMENILQAQKQIDAVFTHEDQIAFGAIDALKEANRLEGVIITGNGGSKDALDSVKAGEMTACITYSPIDHGILAIETAVKILNGEKVEKDMKFDGDIITKDNVDKYLAQLTETGYPYVSTYVAER